MSDDKEEHSYYYTERYNSTYGLLLGLEQKGGPLSSANPDEW